MIQSLTIGCDWPGCRAELSFAFRTLRPDAPGWKAETEGAYSLHLCPAHKHKSWIAVSEAQAAVADGPTTGRG